MSVKDDLKKKLKDAELIGALCALIFSYILGCLLYYVNVEQPGLVGVLVVGIIAGAPWLLFININIFEAFGQSLFLVSLPSHPHDLKQRLASQAAIAITVYYIIASIMILINEK